MSYNILNWLKRKQRYFTTHPTLGMRPEKFEFRQTFFEEATFRQVINLIFEELATCIFKAS